VGVCEEKNDGWGRKLARSKREEGCVQRKKKVIKEK